nr:ORF133 [Leptolyngbya boryana] [Leptolyngbya boryana IAM M-101]
ACEGRNRTTPSPQ